MAFPPQFEEKLRDWPRLLRAELEFDGAKTATDHSAMYGLLLDMTVLHLDPSFPNGSF